jgi:Terpene synthase family 2, C-terminal metal binding
MVHPSVDIADLVPATECGAVCATAGLAQRELLRCAAAYPTLFPPKPFDPAFFATIAAANAFCAPWLPAPRLRLTNRMTLWVFALDRLIDTVATKPAQIDDIVDRCLSTAKNGATQGDPLTKLLAEIRAALAESPVYPVLGGVWYDEMHRMLTAMAREWRWKAARLADPGAPLPGLDGYLDNADFGFSVVYVAHWLATTEVQFVDEVPPLRAAGHAVERVIRLLNDLGTQHRDAATGDLNALRLANRSAVVARIATETARSRTLLAALPPRYRRLTGYLGRQIDFNVGFYRVTDYQGEL